jgi:hypothetical protein
MYMSNVTGITAVGHDSESTISIPKCPDAGCYSRPIVYTNATIRQLRALAEISSECYQSIKVRIRHQFLIITSPRSPPPSILHNINHPVIDGICYSLFDSCPEARITPRHTV